MEEVNAILNTILDDHAACVALDEFAGGAGQLIGEQKSWLFVPEILDHNLANGFFVASQMDSLVEQTRVTIDPGNPFQMDLPPGRSGPGKDSVEHLSGTSTQRDEEDILLVELAQVAVGGQLGIEDQFLGQSSGPLLP